MNIPLLSITDSNNIIGLAESIGYSVVGGDIILLGFVVMLIILSLLVMAKAKAGTSVVIIASMIFLFSILDNRFMFVFWIILVISVFILILEIYKRLTGRR